MGSIYVNVKGKAYWSRVFEENRDLTGYDNQLKDSGGQYTINVDLDADSLLALTEANSQVPDYPRNQDGEITYRFKRPHKKVSSGGKVLDFASGPPKVVDQDNSLWDLSENGWIGNGSEVELKVCVYQSGRLYGTRLETVKVLDHVRVEEREEA